MQTVVLDFETYYDKDFSLSKKTTEEYVRSPLFETIGVSVKVGGDPIRWITGDDAYIREELEKLHLDECIVVAHNAVFDVAILTWRYGIKPGFIMDTMSMARPIIGLTEACSLANLAKYFRLGEKGTEVKKTLGMHRADFTEEQLAAFGEYCRQDVNLTAQLLPLLLKEMNREELELIDLTIRMFTEPVIELDINLLNNHLQEVKAEKDRLLDLVGHEGREAFMSNDKFAELLRAEGVEPPTKVSERTGKTAYAFAKTDDGMKALLDHPNERVQALASARLGLKSTIEETRTQSFIDIAKRGPMPVQLMYYGAANTGRWSGSGGINPQNLPRGGVLRQSMRAPDGYSIVACDSSNIEVRVEATLAGEENLLKVFRSHGDVYCSFGEQIYGHPINKHDNPEERRISKTAVLGLGYGTGWRKLQSALKNGGTQLSDDECQRIVRLYRQHYSKISGLWSACSKALDHMYEGYTDDIGTTRLHVDPKERTIALPNGQKLRYPDLQRHEGDMGWEYDYLVKRGGRKRAYGPYLCLAKGTLVLTKGGWKPIESVTSMDLVWDGEEWVHQGGAICRGEKEVIPVYGVWATPDHKFLTEKGWKNASSCKRYNRAPCRIPDGYSPRWIGREASELLDSGNGDKANDNSLSTRAQLPKRASVRSTRCTAEVFDLLDCGARHQFAILGEEGVVISHNCENITQALARIVVSYQMLAIRDALNRRSAQMKDGKIRQVVHFVHDEVVVVVPEDEQEVTMKMMELIMSKPPEWAPEMPVSCEAGGGKTYGDAK